MVGSQMGVTAGGMHGINFPPYNRTPGFYICYQPWEINEYDMNIAITDPTKEK